MTELTLGSVHERVFMLRHKGGDFYMLVYTYTEHDRHLKTDRSGPFTIYEISCDNTLMWMQMSGMRYISLDKLVTKWDAAEHDEVFRAAVVKFVKRVHTGSWSDTALVCPPMCAPLTYTDADQVPGAPILGAELVFQWSRK